MLGKKAVEWYILVSLILLVLSIVLILAFYFGFFPRIGATAQQSLFGPIS